MNTPSAIMKELTEKMEKPKLCKDCKFIKRDLAEKLFGVYSSAECSRSIVWVSPISGRRILNSCFNERDKGNNCGPEGKYWEAK